MQTNGFSIGQHVYERDTLAPGVITAIDEDGIAEVLFSNGSTDGINLEHLTSDNQVDGDGLDQLGQQLWNEVEALERLDQHLDGDREVEEDEML